MPETNAQDLMQLLLQERSAIVGGAYDKVTELSGRKADLLTGLRRSRNSPESLKQISTAIQHNQTLFAAAIKGIGAARDRLAALDKVKDTLSIYDKTGQMAQVAVAPPGFEKKA